LANKPLLLVWHSPYKTDTKYSLSDSHGFLFEFRGT
jgi:hypothetical protein